MYPETAETLLHGVWDSFRSNLLPPPSVEVTELVQLEKPGSLPPPNNGQGRPCFRCDSDTFLPFF